MQVRQISIIQTMESSFSFELFQFSIIFHCAWIIVRNESNLSIDDLFHIAVHRVLEKNLSLFFRCYFYVITIEGAERTF